MDRIERIIFVGKCGNRREPMAEGIFKDCWNGPEVEVLARGLIVQFPEPMNQKAEAILISNGIHLEEYTSVQFQEKELTENTLVLAMEQSQRAKVLEMCPEATEEQVQVLTDFVGDELEIMDPYGGTLQAYGLCYETLRKSIKKLVKKLNEGE